MDTQTEDAFDRQLQKMNTTIQLLPAKNNDPYQSDNFNLPPDEPAPADTTFQYEDWSPTAPAAPDSTSTRNIISKPAGAQKPDKSIPPVQKKPAQEKQAPAKPKQ